MHRRHFLVFLCSLPAAPNLILVKDGEPKPDDKCGICGSPAAFDKYQDINFCPRCGAQETSKGWEKP
jgi:rubredoxin